MRYQIHRVIRRRVLEQNVRLWGPDMPKRRITTLTLHILSVTMKNTHNSCRFPPGGFLLSVATSRRTPSSSLPLGFNLSQGREGSASFPYEEEEARGGVAHGWLHRCPGRRWRRGNPRYLQKTQACPATFPRSGWEKAGVGSRGISQRCAEEEMDWTDTPLLHHLHLPFPSSVYFLPDVHVCVVERVTRRCSCGSVILHDRVTRRTSVPPDSFINASSRLLILKTLFQFVYADEMIVFKCESSSAKTTSELCRWNVLRCVLKGLKVIRQTDRRQIKIEVKGVERSVQ